MFSIKPIPTRLQRKSFALLFIQKKNHLFFADSHMFFRVHLHFKQILIACGLAQHHPRLTKTNFVCTSAAHLNLFEPSDRRSAGSKSPRIHEGEITECKWLLCFVVRTTAKVTFTNDKHAEQKQLTLQSSSFWTLQLKDTRCIKYDQSQKEMRKWFPQRLLTLWYIFCPKVFLYLIL